MVSEGGIEDPIITLDVKTGERKITIFDDPLSTLHFRRVWTPHNVTETTNQKRVAGCAGSTDRRTRETSSLVQNLGNQQRRGVV